MKMTAPVSHKLVRYSERGHATFTRKRMDLCYHSWLEGAENAVCRHCGHTVWKLSPRPTKGFEP